MNKPYQTYKDSGVEWIGEIPSHWSLKRVNEAASIINGFPFDSKKFNQENGFPLVRIRDIGKPSTSVKFDGDVPSQSIIYNGDILIGMDGDFNVTKWSGGEAALNQRVACVRSSDESLSDFLYYTLPFNMKIVNDNAFFTTVKHLSNNDIRRTLLPYPPLNELKAITGYLNKEVSRIDHLISEKKNFINLLKEKRQALISHVVTKGLDPDVEMKDSGVEWIGEIPKHWSVVPFRVPIKFQEGPGIMAVDFKDQGIPLIRISGVKTDTVKLTGCNYLDPIKVNKRWSHFRLNKGDLLISGSASMDVVSEVTDEAEGAVPYTGLIRLTPKSETITKEYIKVLVSSDLFFTQIDLMKAGATIQHFGPSHLNKMKIVLPSKEEQKQISDYIDKRSSKINALIEETTRSIELLKEHRTALISAAVTGKIDLRDKEVA